MAARVAGVHRVFKMGGAHAIAALAYGTETVPARRQDRRSRERLGRGREEAGVRRGRDRQRGGTDRGLIVADRTATPAWVAADLISQAEHDEMAAVDPDHPREGPRRARPGAGRSASSRRSTAPRSRRKSLKARGGDRRDAQPRRVASARRPVRRRAPRARGRGPRHGLEGDPERRRDLPRPLHAGRRRRLSRRSEPRAADRGNRALLLAARPSRTSSSARASCASSRRSCASSGPT